MITYGAWTPWDAFVHMLKAVVGVGDADDTVCTDDAGYANKQ